MLDWAKISNEVEFALSLDNKSFTSFIASLPANQEGHEITRLLDHMRPATGFLATSASNNEAQEATLSAGTMIGPWKLIQHIGKGGMGDVYRAERADGLYKQTVALKLIQSLSPERAELFEIERQRLARMEHHHIARIIDGGKSTDGRPYMAMEYVDGEPIVEHVQHYGLGLKHRLSLFIEVCDAVNYAHSKLILHRDIKSSNILVASDGSTRLIDFGIASDFNDEQSNSTALTLACAAPEQLKGEAISVQTDVFSLGVLLHELLVYTRPSRLSNGGMEAKQSAIADKDLIAIVERTLVLDPAKRYPSTVTLAEDIKAFLEKRPVMARNAGWAYRAKRFVQRYPIANSLGLLFVVALIVGMATSIKFANEANYNAIQAQRALVKSKWQFERTEATLAAQQAYSDVLQRLFGGDEDVERLSNLLRERWQEAFSKRQEDPNTAAALSYAVGRNYYFRGDNASALEIFDLWMAENIGSKSLRGLGEEVYAMMLSDAGRYDESIEILKKLVAFFGDGSQSSVADASNYANRLARATRAPQDIARSVALLEKRLQSLDLPFERLFSYSQLAGMRTLQADFDAALYAYGQTLRIFENNPGYAAYGRDIARFNLASIVLAWKGDVSRADELVNAILDEDVPLKGESIQQAKATMLKAIIQSQQNQHKNASRLIEESLLLFKRFGGAQSAQYLLAKGIQACLLIHANAPELAKMKLAEAQSDAQRLSLNSRSHDQLKLIDIYLNSFQGSLRPEETEWLNNENIHIEVSSNLIMLYLYKSLVNRQLAPAFWTEKKASN